MNISVAFFHFVFGYMIYIVRSICVVTSPYSFMLRLSVCVMIYIGIYSHNRQCKSNNFMSHLVWLFSVRCVFIMWSNSW